MHQQKRKTVYPIPLPVNKSSIKLPLSVQVCLCEDFLDAPLIMAHK